jgi:transposase-like protein
METAVRPAQNNGRGVRRRWNAEQKLAVLQEWKNGAPLEEVCRKDDRQPNFTRTGWSKTRNDLSKIKWGRTFRPDRYYSSPRGGERVAERKEERGI